MVARAGRVYTLRKPRIWLERICENAEVRDWLQHQIEDGNDVHFVIGLYTLFDAATAEGLALASNHTGDISIPAGELANVPANDSLDIGFAAKFKSSSATVTRCTAPGEQIFATRLKRLEFRFWQKKKKSWKICAWRRVLGG